LPITYDLLLEGMTNRMETPAWHVLQRPSGDAEDPLGWDWSSIPALPPFCLAENGQPAVQQTVARICYDDRMLYVRFDCDDRDIWSSWSHHDDPIYDEEAVELFISPGAETPIRYFEFEVNPNAVIFDALIDNPTSVRHDLLADTHWDCAGLRVVVERDDPNHRWTAVMAIPWSGIAPPGPLPRVWRANLFRIERPRDGDPEFSCWSPPRSSPPDFHKPTVFGTLVLDF
jgi:Carbohydrate-binding family 9